jgi:hypothetical protein
MNVTSRLGFLLSKDVVNMRIKSKAFPMLGKPCFLKGKPTISNHETKE